MGKKIKLIQYEIIINWIKVSYALKKTIEIVFLFVIMMIYYIYIHGYIYIYVIYIIYIIEK